MQTCEQVNLMRKNRAAWKIGAEIPFESFVLVDAISLHEGCQVEFGKRFSAVYMAGKLLGRLLEPLSFVVIRR